jgi:hypothetical protein
MWDKEDTHYVSHYVKSYSNSETKLGNSEVFGCHHNELTSIALT